MAFGRRPLSPQLVLASVVLSAGALFSYAACGVYDESLLVPAPTDGGLDAADAPSPPPLPDAGDAPVADPCAHVFPPARPAKDDGAGDNDVVVELRALDLGIRTDGGTPPPIGFDLDDTCTCFPYPSGKGPETCKPRVPGADHCDEQGGRDDSGGELLRQFAQVSNGLFSQDSINSKIESGGYGLLVRVRHYNGLANDTSVEVDMYVSDGVASAPDGGAVTPAWDGSDVWTLDSSSVIGNAGGNGAVPNYFDTNAYVADHVLVSSVDFPLTLGASGASGIVTLELTDSKLVATLAPKGATFALEDGTVAGRWGTKRLLAALSAVHNPFPNDGTYICPGSNFYASLKQLICRAADIFEDPTMTDSTKLCDALSIGIGFTATPAKLGDVVPTKPAQNNCGDAGADDCP